MCTGGSQVVSLTPPTVMILIKKDCQSTANNDHMMKSNSDQKFFNKVR